MDPTRAYFYGHVTPRQVRALADEPRLRVLQTELPVPDEAWSVLNDVFFPARPDVQLRVYYDANDLGFLRLMGNVQRFAADCLRTVRNIDSICLLPHLEELNVGAYDLESFDWLQGVSPNLTHLGLWRTGSKKPSLARIPRFRKLRSLSLEGQQNGIEAISELPNLKKVMLRSISTPDLSYLVGLSKLWSVDIKLGGIRDLSALRELKSVKYLELWRVRGLSDITPISGMVGLQNLFLQDLRNVASLPDLSKLVNLRRIWIQTLKGLESLEALTTAPALEEVGMNLMYGWDPEAVAELLARTTTRRAVGGLGSLAKNAAFKDAAHVRGISTEWFGEFEYR